MKILGQKIEFNQPELLERALTHRSAAKKNNERLEFLGDSILSFVITKWLYDNFSHLPEGKLSRMRSTLVKGTTLAEIAKEYDLSNQLILGAGELKSGGFNRSSVLADAVEAIFAAVFLDQGIEESESFIRKVMKKWLDNVDPDVTDKDAKTRLQEYLQKNGHNIPEYNLLETSGKDHLQTFKIQCLVQELNLSTTAIDRSRKKSEQKAAEQMLNQITKSIS
ncbi:MAG TPA: ribonuclease III [Gammaproteobacteria bacterium]|nr:ribonuclease III [Xanthomonadales bacterium]HOP22680.1 ribonuclease III [Gammaproteobacteria bacterium]